MKRWRPQPLRRQRHWLTSFGRDGPRFWQPGHCLPWERTWFDGGCRPVRSWTQPKSPRWKIEGLARAYRRLASVLYLRRRRRPGFTKPGNGGCRAHPNHSQASTLCSRGYRSLARSWADLEGSEVRPTWKRSLPRSLHSLTDRRAKNPLETPRCPTSSPQVKDLSRRMCPQQGDCRWPELGPVQPVTSERGREHPLGKPPQLAVGTHAW
jgi:hypothetical protein